MTDEPTRGKEYATAYEELYDSYVNLRKEFISKYNNMVRLNNGASTKMKKNIAGLKKKIFLHKSRNMAMKWRVEAIEKRLEKYEKED